MRERGDPWSSPVHPRTDLGRLVAVRSLRARPVLDTAADSRPAGSHPHTDSTLLDMKGKTLTSLCIGFVLSSSVGLGQSLLHHLPGDSNGDSLGLEVRHVGDVNGDGVPDWVAGAPGSDAGGANSGMAKVFLGPDAVIAHVFTGSAAGELSGWSANGGSDFDGDGLDDVIVGAPGASQGGPSAGLFRVYSGSTGALLLEHVGTEPGAQLGFRVALIDDLDGDGRAEAIAGAPFGAGGFGRVLVVSGTGSLLYELPGATPGSEFGYAIAVFPDQNADGSSDFAIGAPGELDDGDAVGAVRIFSGSDGAVLGHYTGSESDGRFGHAIDSAGDANSDGVQDYVVGAPFAKGLRGIVSLVDGSTGSELYEIEGDSNKFRFGFSVAGVGDFDGVGGPHLWIGSEQDYTTGVAAGAVSLHRASNGERLIYINGSPGNYLGSSVDSLGDLNGDGLPEIAVGARRGDFNLGTVDVYTALACTPVDTYCTSLANSTGAPSATSVVGPPSVSAGGFTLRADDAPPGVLGLFFYGAQEGNAPLGDGILCMTGPTFRLGIPQQVSPDGSSIHVVDFTVPPAAPGLPGEIAVGDTWRFQFWHRDPSGPLGSGFNLSSAVRVHFCN